MSHCRISDWIYEINKLTNQSNKFYYKDNKLLDQKRLRNSNLPTPDFLSFKIVDLDKDLLKDFFNKHNGVFF